MRGEEENLVELAKGSPRSSSACLAPSGTDHDDPCLETVPSPSARCISQLVHDCMQKVDLVLGGQGGS